MKCSGEGCAVGEAMLVRGEVEEREREREALGSRGRDDDTAAGSGADTCNNT